MSAFIVDDKHLDYLLNAGLRLYSVRKNGPLHWLVHEEAPVFDEDHQRGAPWGPTAIENANRLCRELTHGTVGRVGAMLAVENRRRVDHRYDENEMADLYEFQRDLESIDPVQVLKAIDCYCYQSCEHPEWVKSEAFAFCEALRRAAWTSLKGYDNAAWEIRP